MTDASPRGATTRSPWWLAVAVLPVLVVLTVSLGSAVLGSLGLVPLVGEPRLSADGYRQAGPDLLRGTYLSVSIAAAATVVATAVGLLTALVVTGLLGSRRGGGRRWLFVAATSTVPVPHLVGAAGMGLLLADAGLLSRWTGVGSPDWPDLVGGRWWSAVVLEYAWKESAFVALVVVASLATRVASYDDTTRLLGATRWQRLRWVVLPLATPPLVAAATISFAYAVGSYEVAWLLGRTYPEPLPVLAYRLFTSIDLADRPAALAVVVVSAALAAVVAAGGLLLLRASERVR